MSQEQTIRRGVRNARYAAIPNHVFEDSRLSMEARWLLGYLLSKPDNWTVVIGDITKRGNCGRDKARKMIAELVDLGYAEREQTRDDGKFSASVYVIYDEPMAREGAEIPAETASVASLPQPEKPSPVKPSPDSPSPVKSAHSNNSDLQNTDDHQERESASANEDLKSEKPGTADFRKRVQRFLTGDGFAEGEWPRWANGATIDYIDRQFAALAEDERKAAEASRDAFLAKCRRDGIAASGVMGAGNYFKGKVWETLSDRDRDMAADAAARRAGKPEAAKPSNWAPAYGPLHAAIYWRILLAGPDRPDLVPQSGIWLRNHVQAAWPRLEAFRQQTAMRSGVTAAESDFAIAPRMEFVPVETDAFRRWQGYFRERKWPDMMAGERGAYLPRGGPESVDELAAMMMAALGKQANEAAE